MCLGWEGCSCTQKQSPVCWRWHLPAVDGTGCPLLALVLHHAVSDRLCHHLYCPGGLGSSTTSLCHSGSRRRLRIFAWVDGPC